MNETYTRLRFNEWEIVFSKAKDRYIREVTGERPTFKTVAKILPNPFFINALEIIAFMVLMVLTAFTSVKTGAIALPFSHSMLDELAGNFVVSVDVETVFTALSMLLFGLLATPSLVYFQLLAQDKEVTNMKNITSMKLRQSKHYLGVSNYAFSLEYLTPRIPAIIVYASTAWLFYISYHGSGSIFEKFIPVLTEIGLAHLVADLIKKRATYREIVNKALAERVKTWDETLSDFETRPEFLRILYQVLREGLVHLQRNVKGQKSYVNRWLEQADMRVIEAAVMDEYLRLSSGSTFAQRATDNRRATDQQLRSIEATPENPTVPTKGKRVPPAGHSVWTPELLVQDLRVRAILPNSGYSEKQLAADYEPGYEARKAWRNGGSATFTQ